MAGADWTEWTDWAGELSAKTPSLQILFSSVFGKSFAVKSVGTDVDAGLWGDLFVLELYWLPLDVNIFEGRLCVQVLIQVGRIDIDRAALLVVTICDHEFADEGGGPIADIIGLGLLIFEGNVHAGDV